MGRRLTSVSTATSRSLIWITDLNVKDCKSSAQEEKKKRERIFLQPWNRQRFLKQDK